MLVVDPSVLLSPYVWTILRQVRPSSVVVPPLLERAITGSSFPDLAQYWGVDQRRLEATQRASYRYMETLLERQDRTTVEFERRSDLARVRSEIYRELQPHDPDSEGQLVAQIIADEISGATKLGCPILALGSPIPKTWELIGMAFPDQTTTLSPQLLEPDPTSRFRELEIPLVVLAELDPWLIDVLPPSDIMVGYLPREQFLRLFHFIAYSVQTRDSTA